MVWQLFALSLAACVLVQAENSQPATEALSHRPKNALAEAALADHETETYGIRLKPLLARYCADCHGNEKQKADLNLETVSETAPLIQNRKLWESVREMLESREMPPENKPQPSEEERQLAVQFIGVELAKLDCNGPVNPGKVTIRRLNRNEYNNTIRDLIGIDFKPAADFPTDEVGYGFDNIGDVLSLPPILMEKYLAAAETIATQAIVARPRKGPEIQRIEAETLPSTANGSLFQDRALSLDTEGEAHFERELKEGEYELRARAFGQQAGPDPARLAFRLNGADVKVFDVKAIESEPGVYSVQTRIPAGTHRLSFAYVNNYNVQDHPDPKLRGDRNLVLDYVEIVGPLGVEPPSLPPTHTRIISCSANDHEHAIDCGRQILGEFARRAYRRPVRPGEVERLMRFIDLAAKEGGTFEEGVQLAMQAVLVSPYFLYRWELDPEPQDPDKIRPLNDHEIACRLSYFIWSSMPDDELFELADRGVLSRPETVEAQVKRMLRDPKGRALVDNFAAQWLQIRNLELASPDPDLFPEFDQALQTAMRKETEMFFETVMREDRSVLEFIDADFTFVNGRLAQHYGIDGIEGEQFQRVSLDKRTGRGGVLTQASILTITSNPTRTSPVNRGKWILEQILGTPPPPPPPDVEQLPEGQEAIDAGSLRQRLEEHRAKAECATCHNKMDPIGFALENFDAIGRWRDLDGKFPIDPSGTLPSGQTFQGPNDLKVILKSQDTFIRSLSEKMLTFALGRGLEYYDKCAVDDIYDALVSNGYKFSALVTAIVKSDPFLRKTREGDHHE